MRKLRSAVVAALSVLCLSACHSTPSVSSVSPTSSTPAIPTWAVPGQVSVVNDRADGDRSPQLTTESAFNVVRAAAAAVYSQSTPDEVARYIDVQKFVHSVVTTNTTEDNEKSVLYSDDIRNYDGPTDPLDALRTISEARMEYMRPVSLSQPRPERLLPTNDRKRQVLTITFDETHVDPTNGGSSPFKVSTGSCMRGYVLESHMFDADHPDYRSWIVVGMDFALTTCDIGAAGMLP